MQESLEQNRGRILKLLASVLLTATLAGLRAALDYWNAELGTHAQTPETWVQDMRHWAENRARRLFATVEQALREAVDQMVERLKENGVLRNQILEQVNKFLSQSETINASANRVGMENDSDATYAAFLYANQELGAPGKCWITAQDHRVCIACQQNQWAGWIPIDVLFPSGHDRPPAHPRCRCAARYHGVTRKALVSL
jgi:hypothetical protein